MQISALIPSAYSPAEPTCSRRLRVGAILDSLVMPAWVKHILEQVDSSECLELTLLACTDASVPRSAWENLKNGPQSTFFRAWTWLDYRIFATRTEQPNAVETVRFAPARSTPRMLYRPHQEKYFGACELDAIRNAHIDVLLDFTGTATREVHDCVHYGLWSLGTVESIAPSLFRDMCAGRRELEVDLSFTRNERFESLRQLLFPTDLVSLFRNYNKYCWGQAQAITRTLLSLQRYGWEYVSKQEKARETGTCVLPSNQTTVLFLLRAAARILGTVLMRACFREDWFIAYRQHCPALVAETAATEFVVVKAPRDRFYADPFVVERDGKAFIFFEDYSFKNRKAVISMIEIDATGNPSVPEPVLEANYHVSYPCVFEWDGEMYMLPESKDNHTIELYRATDFPRGWRREHVLMTGVSTVDSTVVRYDEKFWLFTSGLTQSERLFDGDNELSLFFSEKPFGPWKAHPKNPIVSDIRRCRPAGRLFFEAGQLIRPSQDCSGRYGRRVCFNRVNLLSDTDYDETPMATVTTHWFPRNRGTHTFNQSGRYQVVDGRTLVSRFIPRCRQMGVERAKGPSPLVIPVICEGARSQW